jgi:hypothetical protein
MWHCPDILSFQKGAKNVEVDLFVRFWIGIVMSFNIRRGRRKREG